MRRQYVIADEVFPTKQAIETRVKAILWGYELHAPLSLQDERLILGLLERHRHAAEKIGSGIRAIHVRTNPAYPNTRGFFIERMDGTLMDFSYRECLYPGTPLQEVSQAMRRAIEPQILAIKTRVFGVETLVQCPITSLWCAWEDVHVDHRPPQTFAVLVKEFLLGRSFVPQDIPLREASDGIGSTMEDLFLEMEWQDYHAERADLWVISITAHVRLTKERLQGGMTV
jgi:hypothetical protein